MLPKKHRLVARMTATAMLAAGTAAAVALPATAETVTPQTEVTAEADPMLQAMQRDLGLTAQEAQQRLEQESVARTLDETLRAKLQDNFGGSYYDADTGTLVVGVTEASALDDVRAAGAKAKLVDASIDELNTAVDRLDRKESSAPESVTGWYVDVKNNSVVVTTAPGTAAQAEKFVAASGVDGDNVEIVESTEQPRTFMDVIGGNAYYMGNGGRCSVGFTVQGGFVTAGHCGTTGTSTSSPSGTFAGSSFPGNDSGSTTGWHCGQVQAFNQTVRYAEGTVTGLTRTNVCAEPGDSGGSFISGNQAQGMTSGGSGNCTFGGTTYFQPVNEVLSAYNLRLITG